MSDEKPKGQTVTVHYIGTAFANCAELQRWFEKALLDKAAFRAPRHFDSAGIYATLAAETGKAVSK